MASRAIDDLTPEAAEKCRQFLARADKELAAKGLRVILTCTYRSQQEQNYLYSLGRTRPGKIVTWTKQSEHTRRRAWDVVFQETAKEAIRWDGPWTLLGKVAAGLGIEWGGGRKRFQDRPHFQVAD